jgi:hypothetical protein
MAIEPKHETVEFYNEFQLVRDSEDGDESGIVDLSGLFDKKTLH